MNCYKQLGLIIGLVICSVSLKALPADGNTQQAGLAGLASEVRPGFMVGTHMKTSQVFGESADIVLKNYNLISVGIYQKQTQSRSRDSWDFSNVDPIIEFAEEHDLTVYAHPMFGSNNYIPDWLLNGDYSNEELLEIMEERIKKLLTRYHGKIDILDVYNEGFFGHKEGWREQENLLLQLGFHENEFGKWPVALEKILIWCRKYGGDDLKLIYNDNHNSHIGLPQSNTCLSLFKALKKAGIPIDGIGIQLHTKVGEDNVHYLRASPGLKQHPFDPELFAAVIRSYGEAGAEVHISESDVHLYGEVDQEKLEVQAKAFRAMLKACIETPACKSYKTWGFTDASCWKPLTKNNRSLKYEPYPLVFDHDLKPKPAYWAMHSMLSEKASGKDCESDCGFINYDDANIRVSGAKYFLDDESGREYLRFREEFYSRKPTELMFNPGKARTTTGVAIQFKTAAEQMNLYFTTNSEDENRGAEFGVYKNGELVQEFNILKKDTGSMELVINNPGGNISEYEITLPSWANPRFKGIKLSEGEVLEKLPSDQRKVYIALGDSISHGTGQGSATHKTWPWLVSHSLDLNLYSLAVGGGKISVPVAEMLEDFEQIDLITILIGYNDWNTGISGEQFYQNYTNLINAIRRNHPKTKIVCISPLFTISEVSKGSDLTIDPFRKAVIKQVESRQQQGDRNIWLIRGETITGKEDIRDTVHLSEEGAARFANEIADILQRII